MLHATKEFPLFLNKQGAVHTHTRFIKKALASKQASAAACFLNIGLFFLLPQIRRSVLNLLIVIVSNI